MKRILLLAIIGLSPFLSIQGMKKKQQQLSPILDLKTSPFMPKIPQKYEFVVFEDKGTPEIILRCEKLINASNAIQEEMRGLSLGKKEARFTVIVHQNEIAEIKN